MLRSTIRLMRGRDGNRSRATRLDVAASLLLVRNSRISFSPFARFARLLLLQGCNPFNFVPFGFVPLPTPKNSSRMGAVVPWHMRIMNYQIIEFDLLRGSAVLVFVRCLMILRSSPSGVTAKHQYRAAYSAFSSLLRCSQLMPVPSKKHFMVSSEVFKLIPCHGKLNELSFLRDPY